MRRLSLRLRLAAAGAVAVILAITAASIGLAALFTAHVERRAISELSVYLDQIIAGLDRNAGGDISLVAPPSDPRFGAVYGGLYWQIADGDRLLRSRSLWDYELPLPRDDLPDGARHVHDLAGPRGEALIAVERSVTLPERLGGGLVRGAVALDRAGLEAARKDFLRDLAPYSMLLAFALIVAGWAQIAVGLRPLADIGARVAAIRSGKAQRLGDDFPSEVRPLASEVDALLDARETDVVRARQRVGDLAHGLKTPLQALLGEAGRLRAEGRPEAAESIEDIAGAMRRHVDRELARTRVAIRAGEIHASVAKVVSGLVRVVSRTREGGAIRWIEEVPEDLVVAADPDDLAEALGALVENAARHAREVVRISAAAEGGSVTIRISDDGPGIPADRIDDLMARGGRADTRGTGLGLAIAADIAEALGGGLTLHPGSLGLEARLSVPRPRDRT